MAGKAGYSGTPLERKLGLKAGMKIRLLLDAGQQPAFNPDAFELLANDDPAAADFTHLFATTLDSLRSRLALSRDRMAMNGMIWVSWPKKKSGMPSEIGRTEVMQEGHAVGLVDVKVCAVDDVWSGLKFVIPLADRR